MSVEKAKTVVEIVEIVFNVFDKILERRQKKRIAELEAEIARLRDPGIVQCEQGKTSPIS
jgi:hypothetical protein